MGQITQALKGNR